MALASASSSAVSWTHSLLSCYLIGQFLTNLAFFQPTVYKSLAGSNKIYYVTIKVKRIRRSDRRLEWERWVYFARSGFPALVLQEKILFLSFFCHPLLTKLVRSRWPDFCVFWNKLGQQSMYPNARDVSQLKCTFPSCVFQCQVHLI